MKKLATLALLAGLAVSACTRSGPAPQTTAPMEAFGELRNDFAVLVDVRDEARRASGYAGPSISVPMAQVEANGPLWRELIEKTPKSKKLIFYGADGAAGLKAAREAAARGFRASYLEGGYDEWARAALPTRH